MVTNALVSCLRDEDLGTRKNCLDFMIKHIDMNANRVFDEQARVKIYCAVVRLFEHNDLALMKRIFKLAFNANDISVVEFSQQNEKVVNLLS